MKKPATILIVEDEESLRSIIRDRLHHQGLATIETDNGKDAIRQAISRKPDLILLDLALPVMDGMSALKKIREHTAGRNIPVIILTNIDATDAELVEDMVAQSPSYYLVKSDWKLDDIISKIKEIVES